MRTAPALVLVVTALSAPAALAQLDCAVAPSILGFDTIPFDGAGAVPTNVTPLVTGADLELRLVGPGGDIPATVEDILVLGSFGVQATMRRVVPAGDLSPGQSITIIADGQARSTFLVGDDRDDAAPAAPEAGVNDVVGGIGGACPRQSSLIVGVASDDAALFIGVVDGQPALGGGVRLDGVSANDELVLFAEGAVNVNVAAVDLAGNVSASVPIEAELPKVALCECAAGSSSRTPWTAEGLVAGALAFIAVGSPRRRRDTKTR